MPDLQPPRRPLLNVQMVLGFLLGIVGGLLWVFLAMFLSSTLHPRHARMYPVFIGAGLAVLGVFALRNARRSSYVMGILIALGLALLLDAAYIVAVRR